jgi:hypothetical protein
MGRQHFDRCLYLLETLDQKGIGRAILLAATLFGSNGAAGAITADVAKKCRELAIQAHPPQPAGTIPYAESERSVFNECVSSTGSLESETPTYRDFLVGEQGGTDLSQPPHVPSLHHRRKPNRLALWGRIPAYPLLSAAGYDDRIPVGTKAKRRPGSSAYQFWSFDYHNSHGNLASRKLGRTHHAAAF